MPGKRSIQHYLGFAKCHDVWKKRTKHILLNGSAKWCFNYHGRICKKTPEKKQMQEILAKYLRFGKWFQNIRILYPYHQFFMVNVGKHTIVPWMRHGIDTPSFLYLHHCMWRLHLCLHLQQTLKVRVRFKQKQRRC